LVKSVPVGNELKNFISLIRAKDWLKNTFIFVPLVFSGNMLDIQKGLLAFQAFWIFCFLSSAIYVFNDLADIEEDKNHPEKRNRPIPSGMVGTQYAWSVFLLFLALSLLSSLTIGLGFFLFAVFYALLNIAYSYRLKRVVILDVFIVASGFVIRLLAGASAVNVPASQWLLICSFLLALFLAFCKRRHELVILDEKAESHRDVLKSYSLKFLDQMISVVTTGALLSYMLYTIDPHTVSQFGTGNVIYTSLFVGYGVFRYLYLVYERDGGGSPANTLLSDPPILVNIFLWSLAVAWMIYS